MSQLKFPYAIAHKRKNWYQYLNSLRRLALTMRRSEASFVRPRSNCLKNCLNRQATHARARVTPERIQILPIFGEEKHTQKFRWFQILAAVALDQHVGIKTLLIEIYVTRSKFLN